MKKYLFKSTISTALPWLSMIKVVYHLLTYVEACKNGSPTRLYVLSFNPVI